MYHFDLLTLVQYFMGCVVNTVLHLSVSNESLYVVIQLRSGWLDSKAQNSLWRKIPMEKINGKNTTGTKATEKVGAHC